MFKNAFAGLRLLRSQVNLVPQRGSKLWEPDYLILAKTKTPEYDQLNLQIRGYDFVILERYQKLIHQIAEMLNIDVANAWAVPAQHIQVRRFRRQSSVPEMEILLRKYERVVQITDPKSYQVPLLLDALATACPPGVTLTLLHHTKEQEDVRYIPDLELKALRAQLEALGGPRKEVRR